jgi:phosphate-selective porin OprO/OprP
VPRTRGMGIDAFLACFLVTGSAAAQLPIPDIRSQLVGSTETEQAPTEPMLFQPGVDAAPPYRPPRTESATEPAVLAGWDDGFYLRSPDRRFSLRVTGQLQADYRWFADAHDLSDTSGFVLRRARFGLEATLFKFYEFRFLPEFGAGQTRLQDGYMNVRYWDTFQFTMGRFKQPFSYEQLIQDRFTPLMERSLIDQVVPQRDLGLMLHGQNLFDGILDYGIAVSNGVTNGDADTNESKDVNARVAVRPFARWEGNPLRRLQIGMSGGWGVESEPATPNTLRTPAGVAFFRFNRDVLADGVRSRLSPEVAYFLGPFGVAAQYFHMEQKFRADEDGPIVRVPFDGFYVMTSCLITGEERTGYSQQIAPRRPFDPLCGCHGCGAWEVLGRVSRIQAGDIVFEPGPARLSNPADFSNAATETTLGFNWYLNRWVRVQFNWEHAWFDQPVRLGPGAAGRMSSQDTLMTRLQFIF